MKNHNRGFTLIELMIGLGIGTFVFVGFIVLMVETIKISRRHQTVIARDEIQSRIQRAVSSTAALTKTQDNSPLFKACFQQGSLVQAGGCIGNTIYGVSLYESDGTQISGPGQAIYEMAPPPIYYDRDGRICNGLYAASVQCPFSVTSTIRAQGLAENCAGCDEALPMAVPAAGRMHDIIEVRYLITTYSEPGETPVPDTNGSIIIDLEDLQ